ncbi:MAG: dienelactone hydrolase family protein [Calditrichaeota bacterium]|nr:MAG: dienelactone hydrolase family protein [Calditrichota bacterium]
MKKLMIILVMIIWCGVLQAALKEQEVEYKSGDVTMKGYLVYDDAFSGKRPGVLVVHEWWGHNEYARRRARMLAELGYTALAVDMYGEGKQAAHPEDAGKFASAVMQNLESAKARFLAAMEVLQKHETVDASRIAAIGYCFGGGVVLHMARMGVDLKGVVSFHGSLGTKIPARPGVVKAKVLVCHGAADKFTTPEQIAAFKKEMEEAGVDYRFIEYPDALHSFTNPDADEFAKKFNLPLGYNKAADEKSWADMKAFLKKVFSE